MRRWQDMSDQKSQFNTEDWWAVYLGLLVFVLSLGSLVGLDLIGWVVTPKIWTELSKSIGTFSKNYAALSSFLSLFLTYVAYLAVLTIGAASLGLKLGKFVYGFTVIFWLTYVCVIVG